MEPNWWEERAAKLSQAADIVSAQANCSVDAALLLLKRRASATSCDLEEIAVSVITRRVRFHDDHRSDTVDLIHDVTADFGRLGAYGPGRDAAGVR